MPTHIKTPTIIPAAGTRPKVIREYVGRVTSESSKISIAQMKSPGGWAEPGQRPEFEETTVVLNGMLRVEYEGGMIDVHAGEAVIAHLGEWVRYSTPEETGAEYIAICLPAFSPSIVHRD
jgi:mannose-6-phosphate isomerase-like protein (cupin superfamily)